MKVKKLSSIVLIIVILFFGQLWNIKPARASTFLVTNTKDSGSGSLRQALIEANNQSGGDTIAFNIPTSDPGYKDFVDISYWKIIIHTPLPELKKNKTTIDGYSQTIINGDTNPFGPEIVIDGDGVGMGGVMSILTIQSNMNVVNDIVFYNAPGPAVRIIAGANNNSIKKSYFGSDPTGTAFFGNGSGIEITSGSYANKIEDCIIGANDTYGVLITDSGTDANVVSGSYIGVGSGDFSTIRNFWDGIYITGGAKGNVIGGSSETSRNIISGNNLSGVTISGTGTDGNKILNNYIGPDANGESFPNVGNFLNGVMIEKGAKQNEISLNVISGNHDNGIYLHGSGTDKNLIKDNIIGANPQETALIPNHHHGIFIKDGPRENRIEDYKGSIKGNVIVGSGWSGIVVLNSHDNYIALNSIGTNRGVHASDLGNVFHGIAIVNASNNEIRDNHIAYNGTQTGVKKAGVLVDGVSAVGNSIMVNSIHNNSGKGIELISGGNGGISTPAFTEVKCNQVKGTACPGCKVAIYSDDEDEGRYFDGSTTADSSTGNFIWSGYLHGPNVTAIMGVESTGNTSEFSSPEKTIACINSYVPIIFR